MRRHVHPHILKREPCTWGFKYAPQEYHSYVAETCFPPLKYYPFACPIPGWSRGHGSLISTVEIPIPSLLSFLTYGRGYVVGVLLKYLATRKSFSGFHILNWAERVFCLKSKQEERPVRVRFQPAVLIWNLCERGFWILGLLWKVDVPFVAFF